MNLHAATKVQYVGGGQHVADARPGQGRHRAQER
jgi:hypothetical protein